MNRFSHPDELSLEALLTASAVQAYRIQSEHFDAAHQEALVRLVAAGAGELTPHLAPPRLALQKLEVDLQVRFTVRQERKAHVGVRLANLGYTHRFGESTSRPSRIGIDVEAVPRRSQEEPTPTERSPHVESE